MFRRATLLTLLFPLCCCMAEGGQPAAEDKLPTTHQEFIPALLELLTQTEEALASCSDASSTQAALPRLRELAERARRLSARQKELSEPTVQDYMSAHPHVAEFNKLWEAVCGHIERLQQARLVTPELRELLQLAPQEGH